MELWKILIFIPIIMLLIAIGLLGNNYARSGDFMQKDVELTGGKIISFPDEGVSIEKIQNLLQDAVITKTGSEVLVQVPYETDEKQVIEKINTVYNIKEYNVQSIGPVLGEIFWVQAQYAIITAFILMAIIVFILFRNLVPSIAVIFAAVTDIVTTAAVMDIVGLKLSLATIAALLMLIGYSIDTDILLTTRLLKITTGSFSIRLRSALKTGLTMSATTISAVAALIIIADVPVLEEIATVLLIGLIIDIITTWLTNAGILRLWLGRKND